MTNGYNAIVDKFNVIFDENGHAVHTGKNLEVFTRYAKKFGGVKEIEVVRFYYGKSYQWAVRVAIHYANGFVGRADFDDFEVARQWAVKKAMYGGPNWADCELDVKLLQKG